MNLEQQPSRWSRVFGMIKSLVSVTVALAALALFLAWMGGAFHEKVPPGVVTVERPSVQGRTLVPVERALMADTVTAVGSVQPRRKTEVASQILTTIRDIRGRPGDRVKAGDVLVLLDDRELLAQQREAIASLASAEADLVTRKSDYERIRGLRASGTVSAEEFNRVEGAYRVAETLVTRSKETISRIDVQISYTKITANSNGLISDRLAEPGDVATPGKPLLTVYDPKDLELHVNVPESLASGIAVGQSLDVRIDASNFVGKVPVREIVPLAQQTSRSVLVKLALPTSSSHPLLPGMFGRAAISPGQTERLWVPKAAVIQRGQLDLVEVAGSDGTLSRRFVRVGQSHQGKVEILSGLVAGEQVALPAQ